MNATHLYHPLDFFDLVLNYTKVVQDLVDQPFDSDLTFQLRDICGMSKVLPVAID